MASKATVTSVNSSSSSVALIAANANRNGLIVSNASTAILYVLMGGGTATATTTGHSVQIPTLGNYNFGKFRGALSGIWASANGSAQITELE